MKQYYSNSLKFSKNHLSVFTNFAIHGLSNFKMAYLKEYLDLPNHSGVVLTRSTCRIAQLSQFLPLPSCPSFCAGGPRILTLVDTHNMQQYHFAIINKNPRIVYKWHQYFLCFSSPAHCLPSSTKVEKKFAKSK